MTLLDDGWQSPWGGDNVPAVKHEIDATAAKARSVTDNNHSGDWQEQVWRQGLQAAQQAVQGLADLA